MGKSAFDLNRLRISGKVYQDLPPPPQLGIGNSLLPLCITLIK